MTRARDVANLIGSGNYSSTTFTATAGQTAFTISHTQGFVQVFMNGLLLDETVDYTSNGSAVTLTSGAAAGDEIEVVAYNTFSVGDALPKSGGTMSGALTVDAAAATVLTVDRATSDGSIIDVQKDGTSVGSIRSLSGDITIDGPSEHTGLRFEAADITPRHNGAASNNYTSLGTASSRYKDLFLGGGLYIGGTGSANKLADYEKGSYTPLYLATGNSGSNSYNYQTGIYTKVGRLCRVWVDMEITSSSGMSGTPAISLPFVADSGADMGSFVPWAIDNNFTGSKLGTQWINASTDVMLMYTWAGSTNAGHSVWNLNTTGRISGGVVYQTND